MTTYGLLISYEWCSGCQSCEVACKEEHGLGILNMMYAVKKYRGSLHREIRKKHGIMIYSLEILLFLPEDSVS